MITGAMTRTSATIPYIMTGKKLGSSITAEGYTANELVSIGIVALMLAPTSRASFNIKADYESIEFDYLFIKFKNLFQ